MRAQARTRQRAAALCVRGAARQARRSARRSIRSSSAGATSWASISARSTSCASHRTASCSASTRSSARATGNDASAKCRYGRGVGVAGSCYISGTNYPIYPNEMPQAAIQIADRAIGPRDGADRRIGDRAGLRQHGRVHRRRRAGRAARVRARAFDRHRHRARRSRCVLVARDVHGRQRLRRCSAQAACNACRRRSPENGRYPPRKSCLAGGWAFDAKDTARRMPIIEAFNIAEAKLGPLVAVGSYNTPKDVHGELPRRHHRRVARLFLHRARRGSARSMSTTGFVTRRQDLGRARLRPRTQPRARRRADGRLDLHGFRRSADGRADVQGSRDHGRAGLHNAPSLLDYRIPTSLDTPEMQSLIVESDRSGRTVRREGSRRGPAAPVDSRDRECDLRCGRCSHGFSAVQSTTGVEGIAEWYGKSQLGARSRYRRGRSRSDSRAAIVRH